MSIKKIYEAKYSIIHLKIKKTVLTLFSRAGNSITPLRVEAQDTHEPDPASRALAHQLNLITFFLLLGGLCSLLIL
jgi:hypothetical protein